MNLLKIAGITLCGAAACLFLQATGKKELAILAELTAGIVLFAYGLCAAKAQLGDMNLLFSEDETVVLAFRMTGIALCMELMVQLCRDAGLNTLAQKAELCGKILLLCLCVSALKEVLSSALSLLS